MYYQHTIHDRTSQEKGGLKGEGAYETTGGLAGGGKRGERMITVGENYCEQQTRRAQRL